MCQDCVRLHAELHKQAEQMYGLRKDIASLQRELRNERLEKTKLIKEKKMTTKHQYKSKNGAM